MKKIIFILLLAPLSIQSSTNDFDSPYIKMENSFFSEKKSFSFENATKYLSQDLVDKIFSDSENKVSKIFPITPYFKNSTMFWFSVYTQYTSSQVLIHDKESLNLVYKVIDFSGLKKKGVNRFAQAKLQSSLASEYIRALRNNLKKLARGFKIPKSEHYIFKTIKNAGFKIPKSKKRRKTFFRGLARNLRTQTGQRDMVQSGVLRSYPYYPFLEKKLKELKLPKELIAIAFLESSFNPKAKSKADAVGIWQLMPFIARLVMPKPPHKQKIDYRKSPIISTMAALQILKENKQNLKRWDLAITAYNSGTKNIRKAQKKFKSRKISLEFVLKKYKHKTLRFASKNFYAEFLALTRTLAYKQAIFPLKGHSKLKERFSDSGNIKIYVSKCKLNFKKFKKLMRRSSPHIDELNMHLKDRTYSAGILIASDRKLTKRRYELISSKKIIKDFPKKYFMKNRKFKCNS